MPKILSAIVAISQKNRVIGKSGSIPWHIPEDLKHFKEITSGHPVIMGRKTWQSIPERFRPLPGRKNIILTRDTEFQAEGAVVTNTKEGALKEATGEEAFIIGGAQVYEMFLPEVEKLYLTIVKQDIDGDTFFPEYENDFEIIKEKDKGEIIFQELERKNTH